MSRIVNTQDWPVITDAVAVRWWQKVIPTEGCWHWIGAIGSAGYGYFKLGKLETSAHRVGYKLLVGDIPEQHELDHLCRNRSCVNPAHLEPVTHRENGLRGISVAAQNARQTHCIRGHELTFRYGRRDCRVCAAVRDRLRHANGRQRRKP